MDQTASRERELIVDLESGGATSEEDEIKDALLGVAQTKRLPDKDYCGFTRFNASTKGEDCMNICNNISNYDEVSMEKVELLADTNSKGEETVALVEMKTVKEKHKKTSSKKHPKPPRPPRGPSLDAVDQKLIREISELAMLKRARIERMKALKKMKAAKATSSSGNLFAMIITIIFFFIILFQGIHSRSSLPPRPQGSPQSSVAARGGLISIQYNKNHFSSDTIVSPSFVEQGSGSRPQEVETRVAG